MVVELGSAVNIRMCARVAGLATIGAEATAELTHGGARPPSVVWMIFLALQVAAVVWVTDQRSAPVLRMVAPALLAAVTAAACWTTLALAVPHVATSSAVALVVIAAVGLLVAGNPGAGRRLPLGLLASAGTALLIFLVISSFLPAVPGFVSNNHPPTYTAVTRLVDPIGELALSVLLVLALGFEVLRRRARTREATVRDHPPEYGGGPNEMVVERATCGPHTTLPH